MVMIDILRYRISDDFVDEHDDEEQFELRIEHSLFDSTIRTELDLLLPTHLHEHDECTKTQCHEGKNPPGP